MMEAGQERMGALKEQRRLNGETAAAAAAEAEAIIAEIGVLERERETRSQAGSKGRVVKSSHSSISRT